MASQEEPVERALAGLGEALALHFDGTKIHMREGLPGRVFGARVMSHPCRGLRARRGGSIFGVAGPPLDSGPRPAPESIAS